MSGSKNGADHMSRIGNGISRRGILQLGLGAAGLYAMRDLAMVSSYAAQGGGGYRALVCVFLYGGNDSFNMLVPTSTARYAEYLAARQNLAVPVEDLLPIMPTTNDGIAYGIHPSCPELRTLFDAGNLAIVRNVGTLVAPLTKAQYQAGGAAVPPQLFSHSDQQFQWQTGVSGSVENVGWGGRVADVAGSLNVGSQVAMNLSLSGSNTFQVGHDTLPYNLGTNGAIKLSGLFQNWNQDRTAAFETLLDAPHSNRLVRQFAGIQRQAIDVQGVVTSALASAQPLATVFPDTGLGRQLRMVARMIAIRSTLSTSRQVFFVSRGGFDTHDDQEQDQPGLYADISRCLAAFQAAMVELGVADSVTAFTGSDFGRTLTSNGDGSDHGWGSHHLVLGGGVRGGDLYGTMPSFQMGGPDDVGGGRLLPTTSVDQYSATLARWYGLTEPQIASVFPNVGNFATSDLGLML